MKPKHIVTADRSGSLFEMKIGSAEDVPPLLEMYRTFFPKPASQGLPPRDPETCRQWAENLFAIGQNFLACRGSRVIGHAALVPDVKGKSGEFVIFVDQDHRSLGIGTELTRFVLETCGRLGFDSVWLTVHMSNFIALKLYGKFGFEYCDGDPYERVMRVRLGPLAR